MKERPILFSGEMVRGLLDGRKTMTRRVIKPQPTGADYWSVVHGNFYPNKIEAIPPLLKCPYGQPGDLLWCKETWLIVDDLNGDKQVHYRADREDIPGPWEPSIFMPRWVSRINLEITGIWVERLQDISEEDAKREGIGWLFSDDEIRKRPELEVAKDSYKNYLWHGLWGNYGMGNKKSDKWEYQLSGYKDAKGSFSSLWASINGMKHPWSENPWVWVISFRRTKP